MSELVVPLDAAGRSIISYSVSTADPGRIQLQTHLAHIKHVAILSGIALQLDLAAQRLDGRQLVPLTNRSYTVSDPARLEQLRQQFPQGITTVAPAPASNDELRKCQEELDSLRAKQQQLTADLEAARANGVNSAEHQELLRKVQDTDSRIKAVLDEKHSLDEKIGEIALDRDRRVKELEGQQQAHAQKNADNDTKLANLQQQLDAATAERDSLQQRLQTVEQQHASAKSDLQSQIDRNGELTQAAAHVDTTMQELRNARDLLNQSEEIMHRLREQVTNEQSRRAAVEGERDTMRNERDTARTELGAVQAELDRLRAEHTTLGERHQEAQRLVEQHHAEAARLQGELDKHASDLVEHDTNKTEIEKKLRDCQTQAADLEAARAALQTSLTDSEAKVAQLQAEIDSGKVDLQRARDDLVKAGAENATVLQNLKTTYETQVAQLQQQLANATTQGTNSGQEVQTLQARITQMEQEIQALNTNIAQCNTDRDECRANLAQCQTDSQALRDQSQSLQGQIQILEAQVQTLQNQVQALEQERDQLKGQLQTGQQGAQDATTRHLDTIRQRENTIAQHENTIAQHTTRIATLHNQIAALEESNRNLKAIKDGVDTIIQEHGIAVIPQIAPNGEIKELRKLIDNQLGQITTLGQERDNLVASHGVELQGVNNRLVQAESELHNATARFAQEHATKDALIRELQVKLQAAQQQIDSATGLQAQYDKLKANFDTQLQQLDGLTNSSTALQTQLTNLQSDNQNLQNTINSLNAQVAANTLNTTTTTALQQQVADLQRQLRDAQIEIARLGAAATVPVPAGPVGPAGPQDARVAQLEAENRELRERLLSTSTALDNTEYIMVEHQRKDSDLEDQRKVLRDLMGKIPRLAPEAQKAKLYSSEMAIDRIKRLRKARPELKLLHNWYNAQPWYQRLMLEELDVPDYVRGILERGEASHDEMNNWYRLYSVG